jgi:hypothetical protein
MVGSSLRNEDPNTRPVKKRTPELAKAVLEQDLDELQRRVADGKRLTKAEREMLRQLADDQGEEPTAPADPVPVGFAKNYVELANVLGVHRRTLQAWRKLVGCPAPRPDGRLLISEWQEFMVTKDQSAASSGPQDSEELKARKLLAEVEERELKVAIRRGEYVQIDEVAREWTTRAGKAVSLLRNKFESELPPILAGMQAAEIQAEARKAIDEVLTILNNESEASNDLA